MTFLEGSFLAGLLGIAIPIAIHLLHRKRTRRVAFPSLRFLKEVEVLTARRSRIQEWLLLLLRAATIAILALALARPVLRSSSLGRGSVSRVFVVDNSMSMSGRLGGQSAIERSLLAARGILERADPTDRAAVFPLIGLPQLLTEDRSRALRAIEDIAPTYRGASLERIITEALREIEGDSNPSKQVYVLSDLQTAALDPDGDPISVPAGVTLLVLRPTFDASPNSSVVSAEVLDDRSWLRATVVARGRGEAFRRVRLSVDGASAAERAVRIPEDGEATVAFELPDRPGGFHRGEIRIEDDVLPSDDRLEVPLWGREPPRVLVARDAEAVSEGRDPSFFVAKALVSGRRTGVELQASIATTEQLASADLSSVDVVLLLDPTRVDDGVASSIERFVSRGGGLFLATGPRGDAGSLAALSRAGRELMPARLGDPVAAEGAPIHIETFQEQHPIWRDLVGTDPPLRPDQASFRFVRRVEPTAGAETLATFTDGLPALVARRFGKGQVLLFASTVGLEWGNLPLRFVFPPWIHAIVRFLSPSSPQADVLETGQRLIVRQPASSGFVQASVELPDGAIRRADATEVEGSGSEADLGVVELPGLHIVHEVLGETTRSRVVSVRPPRSESDLTPVDPTRLEARLPGAIQVPFRAPGEAIREAVSVTVGWELRSSLLWALLGLLLIEPWLANRTAFRRAREERKRVSIVEDRKP